MVTEKPEDEGKKILEIIDKYFPKMFEAKESITWLQKHTTQSKQREWAAIFFEEYCRPLLTNFLGGWYGVRIINSSRIDYQRHYNWDLKVHSIKDKERKNQSEIILNDVNAMNRIIKLESGIGFIIADVDFKFDTSGDLLRWKDRIEGRTPSHSDKTRIMKSYGKVIKLKAIFIKNEKMLKQGKKDGWIKLFEQGRQPNGDPRKPKYMIDLDKVPNELFINLN